MQDSVVPCWVRLKDGRRFSNGAIVNVSYQVTRFRAQQSRVA